MRGEFRRIRGLWPEQQDNFAINEQKVASFVDRAGKTGLAIAGLFITGLALFVGAIGIMNITFVSVKERTREIGTRKALGARRRTILIQFLIEAVSICLIGGTVGLASGFWAVYVDRFSLPEFSDAIFAHFGGDRPVHLRDDGDHFRFRSGLAGLPLKSGRSAALRVGMKTWEIVKMAWKALGVNKLRSTLTTSGITIGIFSIISVMTAISALQTSIETGLSFLGSNTFQFSKYPSGINIWGDEKYRNRQEDRLPDLLEIRSNDGR